MTGIIVNLTFDAPNPVGDRLNAAATVTCPTCGHVNVIRWNDDGTLEWQPTYAHCFHYQGSYSTGYLSTVEARFK